MRRPVPGTYAIYATYRTYRTYHRTRTCQIGLIPQHDRGESKT